MTSGDGPRKLGAEIIITARHPREGGANELSARNRRALLLSFLPQAAWVDIELRSASAMTVVLQAARKKGVRTILSFHDFQGTPSVTRLDELARRAHSLAPDLFKVATRTDRAAQLDRLLEFFEHQRSSAKRRRDGDRKAGPTIAAGAGPPRLPAELRPSGSPAASRDSSRSLNCAGPCAK